MAGRFAGRLQIPAQIGARFAPDIRNMIQARQFVARHAASAQDSSIAWVAETAHLAHAAQAQDQETRSGICRTYLASHASPFTSCSGPCETKIHTFKRSRHPWRRAMKPRDAFAICHEIYVAARELVDERLPTTQLQSTSKFLWRPDLHPRLVEYVADFARAGERALVLAPAARLSRTPFRASRLILFRMHYLGGAEYEAARRTMGISPLTWADWVDEIRDRVGRELMRTGMFPPGRYFREISAPRDQSAKRKYRTDC